MIVSGLMNKVLEIILTVATIDVHICYALYGMNENDVPTWKSIVSIFSDVSADL